MEGSPSGTTPAWRPCLSGHGLRARDQPSKPIFDVGKLQVKPRPGHIGVEVGINDPVAAEIIQAESAPDAVEHVAMPLGGTGEVKAARRLPSVDDVKTRTSSQLSSISETSSTSFR